MLHLIHKGLKNLTKKIENTINTLKQRLSYLNNKKYISFTDDCLEDRKHI